MNDSMLADASLGTLSAVEDFGPISSPSVGETSEPDCAARRSRWRRFREGVGSVCEWGFGALAIVLGLAFLAALPGLQLLSFGYLLESGGRVARTGRIRDAFIGVRLAARLGSMVVGLWCVLLPIRLTASLARSAEIIDPGGAIARRWQLGWIVLTTLLALHAIAACARGGRLRDFFWPFGTPGWLLGRLRRGDLYSSTRDAAWEFVRALHLPYYFRVGALGFIGTSLWLVLPVTLIALGRRAPLVGLLGGLLLGIVALALPFLQMRFAAERRFKAFFEYRAVRERFRRAPWAFAVAATLTLTFAVPLYLLKIEMIPRETAWLPSLLFLAFIVPARTLAGWAYARSGRRDVPRHGFFRWTSRAWMLPVGLLYALIVFFTQFTAWQGVWSLYEQHAFLLPVPFLNM